MNNTKHIYILCYSAGCYESRHQEPLLCTESESKANEYCVIANEMRDEFIDNVTSSGEIKSMTNIINSVNVYNYSAGKMLNSDLALHISKILNKIIDNYNIPCKVKNRIKQILFGTIVINDGIDSEDYVNIFYVKKVEVINDV